MKNLEIFWIRHSVSKSNVSNLLEKLIFFFSFKDAPLIPDAESGSCYLEKHLDKNIKDSGIVGCSTMRRAIQTAILMFPEKFKEGKLKVLPGIKEKGFGPGNQINDMETNKNLLSEWCFTIKKNKECKKFARLFKDRKQIDNAIKKIYSDLEEKEWKPIINDETVTETQFLNCLIPYLEKKKMKKIPIVSHSNYIKDDVMVKSLITRKERKYLRNDMKLHNNQILKKEYQYDKKHIYVRDQKIYDFGCVYDDRIVDCYH